MKNRFTLVVLTGLAAASTGATAGVLSFNQDIRPILSSKCFSCHGFDAKNRKADLRLDMPEGAHGAGKSGAVAIRPGDAPGSEVWKRIMSADPDEVMPPPDSHKALSAGEKEILQEWISQGAAYQKHWAFEAPVKPEVPPMPVWMSGRNEVDRFIFDRLKIEALTPLPEADKETLIRRVTFALTGLPPSLAEVDAFLADASPDAYEKCVDRLLALPAYGEQMARHWLDVARYGDTHGLHLDNERSMWLYRDWVVGALNRNLPFDQFSIEQLAGDLLPEPTQDQLIATGFNRCNVTTGEGGAIDAEFTFRYAVERTSTTAQTWLGLTAGCAQCHDHKYDPVSQKEFYQLYAFFLSAADPAMDGNTLLTAPVMKRTLPEQAAQLTEFDAKIGAAEKMRQAVVDALVYTDPASLVPLPPVKVEERVLVEDDLPDTAKTRSQPVWASNPPGPVASGQRALKVSGKGVTQDYCEEMNPPAVVPAGAAFSCQVFISGSETPRAVMLQFNTNGWKHRAMWGDPAAIPGWGAPDTGERFVAGPLPAVEGWQTLEVDAAKLGLKAGDPITGIAFTQEGGTAWFDLLKLTGRMDDAKDESKSYSAWLAAREGKETGGLPGEVNQILSKVPAGTRNDAQKKQVRDYYLINVCSLTKPALAPSGEEIAKLRKQRADFDGAIPSTFIMKDLDTPRDSFIMIRGAYDQPGERVQRDVPVAFPPLPKTEKPNRLDLARWLVDGQNPLSSRVTVNRFWQQLFGTGLVKTSGDFGSQGQPPSHPELLDWLAVTFRESGWDVKRLMRLLVTSAAFRQSSAAPEALWKRDPENRLLARGPRLRLDAEEVRDNALAVSGLLKTRMGGAGVRPYQPPNIWEPVGFDGSNTQKYVQDKGDSLYRRSLYAFIKRTAPPPFMVNFDAPSREQSCAVRERSNTPMQALQLMNDVQHVEAARGLAARLMTEGGDTPEARITFGCRMVLGRRPSTEELGIIRAAWQEHRTKYTGAPAEAAKLIRQGESSPPPELAEPELAAWTLVANLLLNLDETITRN